MSNRTYVPSKRAKRLHRREHADVSLKAAAHAGADPIFKDWLRNKKRKAK